MNKNKRVLDYLDNIYIDEDFPINHKNMHSLYYLVYNGLKNQDKNLL